MSAGSSNFSNLGIRVPALGNGQPAVDEFKGTAGFARLFRAPSDGHGSRSPVQAPVEVPGKFSPISILAIGAIVLSWLAVTLKWSSAAVFAEPGPGSTLFSLAPEGSTAERLLRAAALGVLALAGLLCGLKQERPRLSWLTLFLFVAMLLQGAFWWVISYAPAEYFSSLVSTTSPVIVLLCVGVLTGADRALWHHFRVACLCIAYASVLVAIYYSARLSVHGKFVGPNPTVDHLQIAFWFGLFALVLHKSSKWRDCISALVPLVLTIPIAMIVGSRSFTLLAILGVFLGVFVPLRHQVRSAALKLAIFAALATLLLGVVLAFLNIAAPDRLVALQERLTEDTRTGQYSQFFSQVPISGLFWGLGPKATYTYNDRPEYHYIDNQFLFLLFKFGLPVLIGYWAIVIWPGLRLLKLNRAPIEYRLLGIIFLLWTLANLGLSIYHSIEIDPQNIGIVLFAGRAMSLRQARHRFVSVRSALFKGPLARRRGEPPIVDSLSWK